MCLKCCVLLHVDYYKIFAYVLCNYVLKQFVPVRNIFVLTKKESIIDLLSTALNENDSGTNSVITGSGTTARGSVVVLGEGALSSLKT